MTMRTSTRRQVVMAAAHRAGVACAAGFVAVSPAACAGPFQQPKKAEILRVVVSTGGQNPEVKEAVASAIERAIPVVNGAAGGRYALEVLEVPVPAPPPGRPYASQASLVAPLLGSGTPPDLMALVSLPNTGHPPSELTEAASSKHLVPLDDHLKRERALSLADFFPAALDSCHQQGQLLGVPLMAVPMLLLYDTQRFGEAGLPPPANDWTWRRFLEAARRLTRDTNRDGTPDEYGFWPFVGNGAMLSLIWQNGGDVVSADKKRAALTDPAAREAIEFFADLYRGEPVCPPADVPPQFTFGEGGMRYAGQWSVGMTYSPGATWFSPSAGRIVGAELPQGKQRAAALTVTGTLSIASKTKDRALTAAAFAALAEQVTRTLAPPPRRLTVAAVQAAEPRFTPAIAQPIMSSLEYSRGLVLDDPVRLAELHRQLTNRLIVPLQRGSRTPAEAASDANSAVQAVLDRT